MASDPGGGVDEAMSRSARRPCGADQKHHDAPSRGNGNPEGAAADTVAQRNHMAKRPVAACSSRIQPDAQAAKPRSPASDLSRRRSQTFMPGGVFESTVRGTGIHKQQVRPQEQGGALRKYNSSADFHRPAASAARSRIHSMLVDASAENLAASPASASASTSASASATTGPPISPNRTEGNQTPNSSAPSSSRPIRIPRPPPRDLDVEMLEASMLPPPLPVTIRAGTAAGTSMGAGSSAVSGSLPTVARDEIGGPSSSKGSLKRSASNGSQTSVTVYECPILEVDEQCGTEEDLSWMAGDQELEQMMAMATAHRRNGRSSLAFKRSQEAAMQCSQVVRNVPRMRKRRDRKLDRRRHSLTLSESTICLSSTPSPTPTPAG